MEYYFNELDPVSFQRLVNAVLVARMGEDLRLTPLTGADGGRDAETATGNPYIEFSLPRPSAESKPKPPYLVSPRPGRYIFQAKFHKTVDSRPTDNRRAVLSDFSRELRLNILPRLKKGSPTSFYLVTNVSSSRESLDQLDTARATLLQGIDTLHADIWWKEQLIAYLDLFPSIWHSFPELFAGRKVPVLAGATSQAADRLARVLRLAIFQQYSRDRTVKFRQIDLAKELSQLFVDLDVDLEAFSNSLLYYQLSTSLAATSDSLGRSEPGRKSYARFSALSLLLSESRSLPGKTSLPDRILLEGGPGQGKSTITQMAAQVYRAQILGENDPPADGRWKTPSKLRLSLRIELRAFAERLAKTPSASLETHIAELLTVDAGGALITVPDLHDIVEGSPVFLILDGLDEVGSDDLRDLVIERMNDTIGRFVTTLNVDLRVVLTSRPPAVAGRQTKLTGFTRIALASLNEERINEYLSRWLDVQLPGAERLRVRSSFEARRGEPHFEALVRNPMQLSILLHFIYLKGDAFPSRRADLYRDYFQIVIDRDVEKSPELRKQRDVVEALHRFLGFLIHSLTEAQLIDGSLPRAELLARVEAWLHTRGESKGKSQQLFKLGEERLGLIAILRGEGAAAKYGFEIQPIREYFAAAYLNDDIDDDAHDLFERMVRRPYWREVALFLAGLRRPKEKADLLARARKLDSDVDLGWRQDGRNLVMQLLREGSFSQPPYVFVEALDFVMDLLDPQLIPVQNEPQGLGAVLPKLMKIAASDSLTHRLRILLDRFQHSNDDDKARRILSLACEVLDRKEMQQRLATLTSDAAEMTALMRLGLPYTHGISISKPANTAEFWEGVSEAVWAAQWWTTGVRFPTAITLQVPPPIHKHLVEQFGLRGEGRLIQVGLNPNLYLSPYAAWGLLAWVDAVETCLMSPPSRLKRTEGLKRVSGFSQPKEWDYTGLDEDLHREVLLLAEAAREVVLALTKDPKKMGGEALAHFSDVVLSYLAEAGIMCCIAARSGLSLLGPLFARSSAILNASSARYIDRQRLDAVVRASGEITGNVNLKRLQMIRARDDLGLSVKLGLEPKAIRLVKGEQPIPIAHLLAKFVLDGPQKDLEAIYHVPLSTELVRPLIEKCRKVLPDALVMIGQLRWKNIGDGQPLRTSDLQAVLRIARGANDAATLRGALIAISSSRFVRLTKTPLLLKLLTADKKMPYVSERIFEGSLNAFQKEDRSPLRDELASGILANPDNYFFNVTKAAAAFIASEFKPGPLLPAQGST